jgi:hypothetical protein
MRKILILGGYFGFGKDNHRSTIATERVANPFWMHNSTKNDEITVVNGGELYELEKIFKKLNNYDIIVWMPQFENDMPERYDIQNIKNNIPTKILILGIYETVSDEDMIEIALKAKANLVMAIGDITKVRVIDPLGCMWYNGEIFKATTTAIDRINYLQSITRQKTTSVKATQENLILKWYFDPFGQEMKKSAIDAKVTPDQTFIRIIHELSDKVRPLMPQIRTNANNPPQVGRCSKTMPSYRIGKHIYASTRAIDGDYICDTDFVPAWQNKDGKVFYAGTKKPSIDTPIHIKLYSQLPNINYIVHLHCYANYPGMSLPMVEKAIPCGAIENADEILKIINEFNLKNESKMAINIKGHGCFIMCQHSSDFNGIILTRRNIPETM